MEKANKCKPLLLPPFTVILLSLIILVHPVCRFSHANNATDTLLPGQSLSGSQILLSKNGVFKFGFNCLQPPCYYDSSLCIWFTNSSCRSSDWDEPDTDTIIYSSVWKPDTDTIILNPWSASFSLFEDGTLRLLNDDSPVWSTNSTSSTSFSAVAVLLDNGNLVIRDQTKASTMFWQSIDYPTDTLLPGGSLGFNKITGKNISLSYNFSSYYSCTLELDTSKSRGFIIRKLGTTFAGIFPSWMEIHEDGDDFITFTDAHIYLKLNSSCFINVQTLEDCNSVLWSSPESYCDFDSVCGPYSLCSSTNYCTCPIGFYQAESGCSRKHNVSLNCAEAMFHQIDGIDRFPDNPWSLWVRSTRECEAACSSNCSCTAYSYNLTCLIWYGELQNTVVLDSGSRSNGEHMYIRVGVAKHKIASLLKKNQMTGSRNYTVILVPCVLSLIVGLSILCRFRRKLVTVRSAHVNTGLMVYSYGQVKNATKFFSEKLGEGGFGYVFKGTLSGSTALAVKKLKGHVQAEKQFRAEVQTIGMIQHINLVRLLGFCAEGRKRLLIYEYMPNGSLSAHLFTERSTKLCWQLRYRIALGIARGLAYLHEECKDCIVHCDMKPDNVLLDAEFCPKIADFGMAKLLGRDFSRVLTTMRGTIGYLAPEWISGLPITHKADVYSYGMMLLEIISGRRNAEKIKEGKFTYFPIFAAVKVNEGDVMCLLDSRLEASADVEQLNRACRIACWCIQDAEDHRPMMGQVVHMLEGVMDVEVPPIPRSLENYVGMEDSCTHSIDLDSF